MVARYLNLGSLHAAIRAYVPRYECLFSSDLRMPHCTYPSYRLIAILPLDSDIRLTTASLECIGQICLVMQQAVAPYESQLLKLIVRSFFDLSSRKKQEIAITTLGLLVGATGKAV